MLVQPTSHVVAVEADMCSGVGKGFVINQEISCWNDLVAEFADVFKPAGMPTECHTVHRFELEPGAMPPFRHQYQVSATELAEVRR